MSTHAIHDILPCPFCGNDEHTDFSVAQGTPDREGTPIRLTCEACGASGPWHYIFSDGSDDYARMWAVIIWNQRA
jgi:Lar family restriction alleviation protein